MGNRVKRTHVRWQRFGVAAGAATAVTTGLLVGVANGAVPVSFAVSGQAFKVSATQLEGEGFSQYPGFATTASGEVVPVAVSNIASAKLYDLCQSVVVAGGLGMKISAGEGGTPATAENLQIGLTDLQGDATFTNIDIGVDASVVGTTSKGTPGEFAQQSSTISVAGLKQTAVSTHAGTFTLNGLHLQLTKGEECF